jgi:hypothetical protein
VVADDRRQRDLVDVVDLPRSQRFPGVDDLVACREDRHARSGVNLDAGQAKRRSGAETAGVQHRTGLQNRLAFLNIRALASDVLPGLCRGEDADPTGGVGLRLLDHDDRVGARRQRCARRHLDTLIGADRLHGHLSREHLLDAVQSSRRHLRGARRVPGAHGVAVHGRARKRRHVCVGHHVARQHASVRLLQRESLDAVDRDHRALDDGERFVQRDRAVKRAGRHRRSCCTT